jgi:parallel beta-helix repeat protein
MRYFLDPVLGNNESVGSQEAPWRSLESVLEKKLISTFRASVITLVLLEGYHGVIDMSNRRNLNIISIAEYNKSKMVPIKPTVPGKTLFSTVSGIKLDSCINVNFIGISVSASYFVPNEHHEILPFKGINLNNSTRCSILNCELFSFKDSSDWTIEDWKNNAVDINIQDGLKNEIITNRIYNGGSVQINSSENTVDGNVINDFPIDGIVISGNKNTISNNIIRNSRKINNDTTNMIKGNSGEENKILNNTLTCFISPRIPFISRNTRGIALLDGFYNRWTIDRNKVLVDHPCGIWVCCGENCVITNNTVRVCKQPLYRKQPPSILIGSNSDGKLSQYNNVSNNTAHAFDFDENTGGCSNNIIVE